MCRCTMASIHKIQFQPHAAIVTNYPQICLILSGGTSNAARDVFTPWIVRSCFGSDIAGGLQSPLEEAGVILSEAKDLIDNLSFV